MKEQISEKEHRQIKKELLNGAVDIPKPIWHLESSEIDFNNQGDLLVDSLFSEGYSIIEVNLENLISKFDVGKQKCIT